MCPAPQRPALQQDLRARPPPPGRALILAKARALAQSTLRRCAPYEMGFSIAAPGHQFPTHHVLRRNFLPPARHSKLRRGPIAAPVRRCSFFWAAQAAIVVTLAAQNIRRFTHESRANNLGDAAYSLDLGARSVRRVKFVQQPFTSTSTRQTFSTKMRRSIETYRMQTTPISSMAGGGSRS